MPAEIHVDDIGTIFRVTVKDQDEAVRDLSSTTTKTIIFKKPDNTLVEKTASFYTDGTDGIIQYVAESGFIDQPAIWQLQGSVVFADSQWKTDIYEFRVHKNLE